MEKLSFPIVPGRTFFYQKGQLFIEKDKFLSKNTDFCPKKIILEGSGDNWKRQFFHQVDIFFLFPGIQGSMDYWGLGHLKARSVAPWMGYWGLDYWGLGHLKAMDYWGLGNQLEIKTFSSCEQTIFFIFSTGIA